VQRIAVIDTGLCNLDSACRAIEDCGAKSDATANPADLELADKIVLPGVGAFPDAMDALHAAGLVDALREQVLAYDVPVLGICLGMQLLASRSEEVRPTEGLGFVPASVVRLQPQLDERVPHVGWNEITVRRNDALVAGVAPRTDFYFVHSFHMVCEEPDDVIATTPYCGEFTSVVGRGNVFGTQFHPEKSQRAGLALLANFVGL
jgi:glutamine amidotransferase